MKRVRVSDGVGRAVMRVMMVMMVIMLIVRMDRWMDVEERRRAKSGIVSGIVASI